MPYTLLFYFGKACVNLHKCDQLAILRAFPVVVVTDVTVSRQSGQCASFLSRCAQSKRLPTQAWQKACWQPNRVSLGTMRQTAQSSSSACSSACSSSTTSHGLGMDENDRKSSVSSASSSRRRLGRGNSKKYIMIWYIIMST